jgi:hypothetical protein
MAIGEISREAAVCFFSQFFLATKLVGHPSGSVPPVSPSRPNQDKPGPDQKPLRKITSYFRTPVRNLGFKEGITCRRERFSFHSS